MEVLFCFDDRYEQHFGVAVTSLILNNADYLSRIHLITNKVSSKFNKKLDEIKAKANIDFAIYEIDDTQVQDLRLFAHLSPATYYRLLAPDILPQDINKVLYLDSDLIVDGSILELYNYDISDYIVAACAGERKAVTTKKRLELTSDYYFNVGVVLINLETWRHLNVGNKCIELLRDNPTMFPLLDQDVLNKVIDGQFLNLNKKWNSLVELYTDISQVDEESKIIHFIGSLKPWHSWCINDKKNIYWSYLRKSPWSNASPDLPNSPRKVLSAIKSIFKQLQNYRKQSKASI